MITSIGDGAFKGCTSLKAVYITDIEAWLNIKFYDTTSNPCYKGADLYLNNELLTSVTIPDSVTSIGDYAFYRCKSLASITFDGTKEQWNAITFGYSWNNLVPATEVICSDGTAPLR